MATFTLQILHASDLESGIPALTDAVNFSTVVNALRDDYANTLTLSSGDNYIPGPFFSAGSDPSLASVIGAAGPGRPDIAIMNEIGFQAAAFGNHEFDLGTSTIQSLIVPSGSYAGARFPYLSSNLDFSGDANLRNRVVVDGQDFTTITAANSGRISGSAVITVNGQRIGLVGATTPTLPSISSPGPGVGVTPSPFASTPTPQQLDALAAEIQSSVNALTATGINKVIVLAHMQQLFIERELAKRLRDVDVVIAGGSHTLLPDSTDRLRPGDTAPAGIAYPIVETSPTGPVLVVNTAANYTYVGRLVAEFDDAGQINVNNLNPAINGAYATDAASVAALTALNLAGGATATPDPEVVAITNALRSVIVAKDSNIFGSTNVFLNGTRDDVRTQETNLGNVTADASLFAARQTDPSVVIALKNGGGIRDNIGTVQAAPGSTNPNDFIRLPPPANPLAGKTEGQLSQLDIENSLRFNNSLSLVTVSAQQLLQLIEHGVADTGPGRTPGRFPQVGGMAFSFDANRPAGDRVLSLAIKDENGRTLDVVADGGELLGDPNRTFRMVTLGFLASGGDGYPFPTTGLNRVDLGPASGGTFTTPGTEQKAFADYARARFNTTSFNVADVGPAQDTRIQNLSARTDTVFNDAIRGNAGNNNLSGNARSNIILGRAGNDQLNGLAGDDDLFGGAGNDRLFAGAGRDRLSGDIGNDRLLGDLGNDVLEGGLGVDFLLAGAGNDRITGGSGADNLNGGAGFDVASYRNSSTRVNVNLFTSQGTGGDAQGDQLQAIEFLEGSFLADTLVGSARANVLSGLASDDLLNGGAGIDRLIGGAGNDHLLGGTGRDVLFGEAGDDTLVGGAGPDRLVGGSGSDRFVAALGAGADTIIDFTDGQDLIALSAGLQFGQLTISQGTGATQNNTLIRANGASTELLAVLVGVQANLITAADFVTA
ncbi:5'-nucleotidase C-terminal domain-containing protein [Leptolyngbya sp. FACHB-261]|uniref:5'-nucleotidase C-terminal domain-containing protein n=1 Tax=Leptolyngbya sp. FACHB-261 TaxID=2692806 RepID=UPI001683B142|nr:5'-nucleotidase C-terminal domain-containing protein [Leptolyngbya sp. FACHB-261]MBD2104498.1 5'-nucleotidase C-terminal domain-containing protein [Leptolyngbya sp. FACHB-261]